MKRSFYGILNDLGLKHQKWWTHTQQSPNKKAEYSYAKDVIKILDQSKCKTHEKVEKKSKN